MAPINHIVVVGAGPAGLLLGLLLGKKGIKTTILEKESRPTDETRAVFYQPVAQFEFERAGILDDVKKEALEPKLAAFRDINGQRLFEVPGANQITWRERNVEIRWGSPVVNVDQGLEKAWVEVDTGAGYERIEADYVVACDGGQSTVRRKVFGEGVMEGFTWDKRLVAADLVYDISAALPDVADSNLFIDARTPFILFRTSKKNPHQWRVIYEGGTDGSDDELISNADSILAKLLPGHPSPEQYETQRLRPYHIHQRCVSTMRKGRIVLASDAAHLCCPFGALGLNGGIADIGSLYDCFSAIHDGVSDESILDIYDEVRRKKWKDIIDPQSQGMLRLVYSDPNDVVPSHPIYRMGVAMKENPIAAKANAPDPYALRYDFSKHCTRT